MKSIEIYVLMARVLRVAAHIAALFGFGFKV
jgi:hypothetical protein